MLDILLVYMYYMEALFGDLNISINLDIYS